MVDRTRYSDNRSRPIDDEGIPGQDEGSDGGFIAQRAFGNARAGFGRGETRHEGRGGHRGYSQDDRGRGYGGRGGFEDRDHGRDRDYGDSAGYGGGGSARDYRDVVGHGFDERYSRPEDVFRDRGGSSTGYSRGDYSGGFSGNGGRAGRGYGGRDDRGFLDRAGDEIASWFGSDDAERRRRQDAQRGDEGAQHHRGRGPKNYQRSDERIREDVNDRLTEDHHIDASDIEVHVENREVTLTGTVASRFAKRHAEDIAESVSGVAHVQNNIRVRSEASAGVTPGSGMDPRGGSGSGGMI